MSYRDAYNGQHLCCEDLPLSFVSWYSTFAMYSVLLAMPLVAQQASPGTLTPWTVEAIYGQAGPHGEPPPDETAWSPDGSRYSFVSDTEGLVAVDVATGKHDTLVPAEKLKPLSAREVNEKDRDHRNRYDQPNYFWSPDAKEILFDEDGTLWLYRLAAKTMQPVGDTGQGSGDDPKFSPDGTHISYVHAHNLYVEKPGEQPRKLTSTGNDAMLNGEVDWVYLEELGVRTNYAWAPDSEHLAYVQMDERRVPEYPLVDYIPTHAATDLQRYPQPGDPNPAVHLGVVSAGGGETKWIDLPIRNNDDYITRFGWIDAHTVWAETLTRDHQHLDLYFADPATGAIKHVLAQTDAKFLDENYDVHFYAPGAFLLTSWRDGHTHIYTYSYNAAAPLAAEVKLTSQLEQGAYEVMEVLSIDKAAHTVYYGSTEPPAGERATHARCKSGPSISTAPASMR